MLSKRQHEKLLKRKLPEKLQGQVITFGTLSKDALAHSREQNDARSTHELALKLAIIGVEFNARDACSVTKQDVTQWLMEQTDEREWSPATRNRYQAAFSLVFRVAVDNEKLAINPASRIKRKAENNDRIRFLSDDEEAALVEVIQAKWPRYLPAFLVSIHTGMRASEQFGLAWPSVSFERKTVTLHKTKPGKTRHIRLNSIAMDALQQLAGKGRRVGPVFLNTEGEQLRSSRDWFEPAVVESGINQGMTEDDCKYTWHCNRHTFASRLVMAGVDIRTVAQLMGHSTIQMTMRYAHLAPEHNQSAVDRLVPVASKTVTTQNVTATKSATGQNDRRRQVEKSGIRLIKSAS